jgi:hypothetical protein
MMDKMADEMTNRLTKGQSFCRLGDRLAAALEPSAPPAAGEAQNVLWADY